VIGIEACGASHHWARILRSFGHEVKLIAPQLVKPYVKRGKNDTADAEALCEAMSRPRLGPTASLSKRPASENLHIRRLSDMSTVSWHELECDQATDLLEALDLGRGLLLLDHRSKSCLSQQTALRAYNRGSRGYDAA
jgi:hypothetical protein